MIELSYAALTHQGKVRFNNEDNYYIDGKWRKDVDTDFLSDEGVCDTGYLMACVCDGMGGEAKGEEASLIAVETLDELCEENRSIDEEPVFLLRTDPMRYFDLVTERIHEVIRQEQKQVGTTFAAVEFTSCSATAINIGDSTVFRYHDGEMDVLSQEHTLIGALVRDGILTREEARKNPYRHNLSRFLGAASDKTRLTPFISEEIRLYEGDIYLICSDGLTDMLTDDAIKSILEEAKSQTPKSVCEMLVDRAMDEGGRDNITVVLVKISQI